MKQEYIEKIYAGWLAKIIGIRHGAPIEGWTYQRIRQTLGEIKGYPLSYKTFAADDDSNGPLFFLRAIEDSGKWQDFEAQDVGEALLNYAPFEHGFFWWGGYGISTEHTAYLNLRNGIRAPQSGSIALNGYAAAEQIGGQIFIDTWGLVNPGNPDRAAEMARKAASVTHDGNAVYGGMFIAACIAYAFVEHDIEAIIAKGLSYIPEDCEYARVVKAVTDFYHTHNAAANGAAACDTDPSNTDICNTIARDTNPRNASACDAGWRDCFNYIYNNFGYDKYPGNCHIIPNTAVMILGLLYGKGNFDDTLNITNMCGWDTDCNVGNIATIMGVVCGLEGINYEKWRKPIDDVLVCSSCVGSLNIMDIPYGALYIAKLAYALDGEEIPEPYGTLIRERIDSCHFEFPGSTHHIMAKQVSFEGKTSACPCSLENSDEVARTGSRSLKFTGLLPFNAPPRGQICIYKKTYYEAADFSDSRYDPEFSPIVYPGMTLHASVYLPAYGYPDGNMDELRAGLYAHDSHGDRLIAGEMTALRKDSWVDLQWRIPADSGGMLLDEMGVILNPITAHGNAQLPITVFIDDLYADGAPDYVVDTAKEHYDYWGGLHTNISQFTRLKGLMSLQDGHINLSCSDFAEAYTGRYDWSDYTLTGTIVPVCGKNHYINARVQGAIRSYAAGFVADGKFAILKNAQGYRVLASADFAWEENREYTISLSAKGNTVTASLGDVTLEYRDEDHPYLTGSVGISNEKGSHTVYKTLAVKG